MVEAAETLGYAWRQCQRWFAYYKQGGLQELLKSRVEERGRKELVTPEAFEELQEAMKRGEIATISEAHRFLSERGIEYSHPDGVGQLLRRRKVKLKTGRPRHEKAELEEQEALKKGCREGNSGPKARRPPRARQAFVKVMAFDDEAVLASSQLAHKALLCEGLSSALHRVRRTYKWTYLYAALEPTTGVSFCLYLPGMDSGCMQSFLEGLSEAYPENYLLLVLDGGPSHRSEEIVCPDNVDFLRLPAYFPELDPVER